MNLECRRAVKPFARAAGGRTRLWELSGSDNPISLIAQFGSAITEIKEIELAIEAAASSVEAAREEISLEVGIYNPAKFNALAAPVEAKQSAPWLRRRLENGEEVIRVVDLEKGVERQATPEEVTSGIIAQTLDEYTQRKAA